MGDGTRISFRYDLWCGDPVLKVAFSILFGIACAKDASVAANMEVLGRSNQWNVSFSREAHDESLKSLLPFSRGCIQLECEEGVKIDCGTDFLQKRPFQGQVPLLLLGLY